MDVVRLCREKFTRIKAQLEFNLAVAIKDNKMLPYLDFQQKAGLRTIHFLWNRGGNAVQMRKG